MENRRYVPTNKIRVVTAAALFDGHDASINIFRRLIQAGGAEVIHLGHNRSVGQVVEAILQEDAQAVAISSYQGGHTEYFRYLKDLLVAAGAGHVKIFGGGGGVIVPEEIRALHDHGIDRVYSPEDGRRLGLQGIINDLLRRSDMDVAELPAPDVAAIRAGDLRALARAISHVEAERTKPGRLSTELQSLLKEEPARMAPVVGVTGTGGAGKSSFVDEWVLRFRLDFPERRAAILSVDPTRRKTGGALLGDRIRMNAIYGDGAASPVFMRSLATRESNAEISAALADAIRLCQHAGFDLILIETSGIGQADSRILDVCDIPVYVMTPEYGAPTQLEKIDMLDNAAVVILNKFERRGAEDALRDVRRQVRRNREVFHVSDEELPVFGTIASQFNDAGVTASWRFLCSLLKEKSGHDWTSSHHDPGTRASPPRRRILPPDRTGYLGEVARTVRTYHRHVDAQIGLARRRDALERAGAEAPEVAELLKAKAQQLELAPDARRFLDGWPAIKARYQQSEYVYTVRGREIRQPLTTESLTGLQIPRVALPRAEDPGELLRFGLRENLPGFFPFTAGVFPLKRTGEDPRRMFAGEGGPARTNARFHYLCKGEPARLSTAFDSVTLYGEDPAARPDIFGKIGESGVSVPTLADMQVLYSGFDLCDPSTSVSMTINGPAPILLAMFFNTAIEQQAAKFAEKHGRAPDGAERDAIQAWVLKNVRGTVQADILKEDQAQNTCIFSTEFALRMMGDIQQYFVDNDVRNYYSVSISGYHIAEAGANPVSQLAFTLANGLTFVEYYRARGMAIDDYAPNLSFFFSNGMDPEYTVIGRVARRIWAVAMQRLYGGSERSQMLKYHIQTSGRSLHAREIQFNDIRTTLQALLALFDNCNSLHTNAYDEAVTTPTEESVRRAMAIQMIISKEMGWAKNENPLQGSYIIEELTDLVEEAVLKEFERIDARGGVLGAMETMYQRGKIQEESLYYEQKKHDGSLPIVGINTFQDPATLGDDWEPPPVELRRASYDEKNAQIAALKAFQELHRAEAPEALARLQQVARGGGNVFAELMRTVRVASLGQITGALYAVGGEYRRNM